MDIRLPSLGEGADSGVVVNILVKEGDQIAKDQPILELETEKAVGTIPATAAGKVERIKVKVGDKISAGQVLMTVGGGGGAEPAAPAAAPVEQPTVAAAPMPVTPVTGAIQAPTMPPGGLPVAASPTVRKLARELGIDLARVRGTEPGGRIAVADLRSYIVQLQQIAFQQQQAAPPRTEKPAEQVDFAQFGPVLKKPVSSLRATIGRRLLESWNSTARVTQFDEVELTGLNELRKKYAKAYEANGARLTPMPFAIKAVVAALRKHPMFNASLDAVAGEVVLKEYFHIGIAVDTEHGLLVPVIRDADKKSMLDVAKELEALAGKARERKLSADEMRGGTFTISNQGGIGSGAFTPIVNKPEVAILGMARAVLKPVVRGEAIVARLIMPVSLSYDHRVVDGADAARFMVDLVKAFEAFSEEQVRL